MTTTAEHDEPLHGLTPEQRHEIAVRAEDRLNTPVGRFGEAQFWAQAAFERLSKQNLRSAVEAGQTRFVDDYSEDERAVLDEMQKARDFLQHARREIDEAIRLAKREARNRSTDHEQRRAPPIRGASG